MKAAFLVFLLTFSVNSYGINLCHQLFFNFPPAKYFSLDLQKKDSEILVKTASKDVGLPEKNQALEDILIDIKNGKEILENSPQFLFLKAFRKEVSILKNAIIFSTRKNSPPKLFSEFVKELGVLNDLLAMGENQSASLQAETVLKLFNRFDFSDLTTGLKYSTRKEMANHFKEVKKEIKNIFNKNKITVDEFHDIRKLLKEYLNYFQLMNKVNATPEMAASEKFFYDLNEDLGIINDRFTVQIHRGERKPSDKVKLPDSAKEKIEYILESDL